MRLRLLAVLFAVSFATAAAHAQVASIYVTSANLRVSNLQTGYTTQEQYTGFWSSGVGGGLTLNFLPLHVVNLGFDFRGSTKPGTPGADTAFGGIRLQINPPALRIKPYVEVAGGYLSTRSVNVSSGLTGATFGNQFAAYEILGGLDYPLIHFVDFRIVEVGGGQAVAVIGGTSTPNPSLFTIDTGLVLHF